MAKKHPRFSEIGLNDFSALWRDIRADVLEATERVGQSGWYILGNEVAGFETNFAKTCQAGFAIGCANGLDAIELSLRACGIKPGDRVLTTPLSAFATTLAILRAGGIPIFADVDESGLIDLVQADQILRERPEIRFMVPVHLYGHALNLAHLKEIRERFGLMIVEDCAQAVSATSGGKPVGCVGALAATSFYPTKNLGCIGDGGAVFTNDSAHAQKVRFLRDYGQSAKYVHEMIGLNSRLDEIQAAILRTALLPRLPRFTAQRKSIAARYRAELENFPIPPEPEQSGSVYHLFPLIVNGSREKFQTHLASLGIASAVHYPVLIPDQPAIGSGPSETIGELPNARRFAANEVSIPIHPYMSAEDVTRVVEACNAWKQ